MGTEVTCKYHTARGETRKVKEALDSTCGIKVVRARELYTGPMGIVGVP